MEITKFTIERRRWGRGLGSGYLSTGTKDPFRCCLGFLGLACGYTDKEMDHTTSPHALIDRLAMDAGVELDKLPSKWPSFAMKGVSNKAVIFVNSDTINLLMEVNDSTTIVDTLREQQIIDTFAAQGIIVEFIP